MNEILILPACAYELCSVFNVIGRASQMFFSSLMWAEHSDIMTKAIEMMIRKSALNECSLSNAWELWEKALTFFLLVSLFIVKQKLQIKQIPHLRTPATFKVGMFQIFQQALDHDEQS